MSFKLGVIQTQGNCAQPERFKSLVAKISACAEAGAQIILLSELILHNYFCITENQEHFNLAHDLQTPLVKALQSLAAEKKIVLILPFFEKRAPGLYHNSAVVFDADGTNLGLYRKMHIPEDPGFNEKYYFTPGDLGFKSFTTRYGKIGVLICWDQWYPEAARITALQGCELLVYPTAIGWDAKESEGLSDAESVILKEKQVQAWTVMHRAHAVANNVYVAAANRIGQEGHLEFWGNSFVTSPEGEVLAHLPAGEDAFILQECKTENIESTRRIWPFLRDRRIDAYGGILQRFGI